jgi:hypothetical protein
MSICPQFVPKQGEGMSKRFEGMAAQGEILLIRVDEIPDDAIEAKKVDGKFLVGHSETGHHHTVDSDSAVMLDTKNPLVSYLEVLQETDLKHERDFDTHESLRLTPGKYKVQRQREFSPEGWRQVAD